MRIRVVDSHNIFTDHESHISAGEIYSALKESPHVHRRLFLSLGKGTTVDRLDSGKGRKIYGPAWVHIDAYADGNITQRVS
ncbi:hypothetical protein [Streptomyces sp. NPDC002790]|uniref:hypothetical protein n=1 Tax=Streptomyces sp. NPDC002790 TaxID=3154431 RepID=UPI00332F8AFB